MGQMVDGRWQSGDGMPSSKDGGFDRQQTVFRERITPDGAFRPEPGRYHLYVSLACPWAHRTLIFRVIKGLAPLIGVSVTHWFMGPDGWTFAEGPGVVADTVNGAGMLHEVYAKADTHFTGRVSVPVLWDRASGRIVNNESAEIIRDFNAAFDDVGARPGDYYPKALREEIDALNARIYDTLNNGVYKCGFARTQAAYDAAIGPLTETIDWLEERLSQRRFLCGETITEADWRLFTTLVRYDAVYHGHFKCNTRRISDQPALSRYLRALCDVPGVAETIDLGHIKRHYYQSHPWINPTGIVPAGPPSAF